jgi:hypothetical protein
MTDKAFVLYDCVKEIFDGVAQNFTMILFPRAVQDCKLTRVTGHILNFQSVYFIALPEWKIKLNHHYVKT